MDPPSVDYLLEALMEAVEAAVKKLENVRKKVWACWQTADSDADIEFFDKLEDEVIEIMKLLDERRSWVERWLKHG